MTRIKLVAPIIKDVGGSAVVKPALDFRSPTQRPIRIGHECRVQGDVNAGVSIFVKNFSREKCAGRCRYKFGPVSTKRTDLPALAQSIPVTAPPEPETVTAISAANCYRTRSVLFRWDVIINKQSSGQMPWIVR